MTTEKLSKEAREILETRIGYRSEDKSEFADDWHINIPSINIIDCEMNDLGNSDIPETMHKLYGTPINWQPKQIDQYIKQKLSLDDYYLIWVTATPEDAHQYADESKNITKINLNCKKMMLISDIATDGVLLATDYEWIR